MGSPGRSQLRRATASAPGASNRTNRRENGLRGTRSPGPCRPADTDVTPWIRTIARRARSGLVESVKLCPGSRFHAKSGRERVPDPVIGNPTFQAGKLLLEPFRDHRRCPPPKSAPTRISLRWCLCVGRQTSFRAQTGGRVTGSRIGAGLKHEVFDVCAASGGRFDRACDHPSSRGARSQPANCARLSSGARKGKDGLACLYCLHHPNVLDGHRIHLERISIKNDEVSKLARFE